MLTAPCCVFEQAKLRELDAAPCGVDMDLHGRFDAAVTAVTVETTSLHVGAAGAAAAAGAGRDVGPDGATLFDSIAPSHPGRAQHAGCPAVAPGGGALAVFRTSVTGYFCSGETPCLALSTACEWP